MTVKLRYWIRAGWESYIFLVDDRCRNRLLVNAGLESKMGWYEIVKEIAQSINLNTKNLNTNITEIREYLTISESQDNDQRN